MRDLTLLTSSCLPIFIVAYQNRKMFHGREYPGPPSCKATTLALSQALHMINFIILCTIDDFMAKKSLNMIERMMDPNIIDYYMISCAIPSIITIENRYQIDFGKPA